MKNRDKPESGADKIVVQDRISRRRFIRAGSAFLVTGAAMVTGRSALAADCDQNGEQQTRCSDQDTGENADPTGCGRCGRLAPTSMPRARDPSEQMTAVGKVVVKKKV